MIAVKRLQSLFWIVLVALGALGAYLVSLKVATERNELMRVRMEVARTRADIRYLETEFSARANMRQLERWNAEDFLYGAPVAAQYLGDQRSLAHLEGIQPNGPAYVAPPVMVAMTDASALAPEPAVLTTPAPAAESFAAPIAAELSVIRPAHAAEPVAPAEPKAAAPKKAKAATVMAKAAPDPAAARHAERMAMLDASLLDTRTLGDITAKAARESKGVKR